MIYLGDERGFKRSPDQLVRGLQFVGGGEEGEEGEWTGTPHWNYAHALAAGDFDGDGLCDLAVSTVSWARQGRGHVDVYRGRAASGLRQGSATAPSSSSR